ILSAGCDDLAPWCVWEIAARESVDEKRGPRTPLFLRIGLGGLLGSTRFVAALEGVATRARVRCDQAGCLCGNPRVRRKSRPARAPAADSPNRSGRACCIRLTRFRVAV